MTLLVLGISHRSAPVSLLDQVALDSQSASQLASRALEGEYVTGAAVLSTCNRVEIIADVTALHGGLADIGSALVDMVGLAWPELVEHIEAFFEAEAVLHLLRLACGMESMIFGEPQILGQVRDTFIRAKEQGTVSSDMTLAFQHALRVGKRVRSETNIEKLFQSMTDIALDAAEEHIGFLRDTRCVVIGAGAMAHEAVRAADRAGVRQLLILNRSLDKATALAERTKALPLELTNENLVQAIAESDVIISVTGAMERIISVDDAIAGMQWDTGQMRKKFFIDLAIPFDIDPGIAEVPYARLFNLESFPELLAESFHEGVMRVYDVLAAAEGIVEQEIQAIEQDRMQRTLAPTVSALRSRGEQIVEAEFTRLSRRLGNQLGEAALQDVRQGLVRVVEKILHTPTVRVKELSAESPLRYSEALTNLFDLSNEPELTDEEIRDELLNESSESHNRTIVETIHPQFPSGVTVRLGTRRSSLAISQSRGIAQKLAQMLGWQVEIVEIVTEGDVNMSPLTTIGGTGVFVSAVRTALMKGEIDIAVHSLKDLPTAPAPGIISGAIPPRNDPSDVLIARGGMTFQELPPGSVIGTGSPRRAAQLRAARPDIKVKGVRGNVNTRIEHVHKRRLDAVVLAAAGMRRLDFFDQVTDVFDPMTMLPAPGQGALAVECRSADTSQTSLDRMIRNNLKTIHDEPTALAVMCERAVLARAEAGCSAPIGAMAELDGRSLQIHAVMADDAGKLSRVRRICLLPEGATGNDAIRHAARELGEAAAEELLDAVGVSVGGDGSAHAPEDFISSKYSPHDSQGGRSR